MATTIAMMLPPNKQAKHGMKARLPFGGDIVELSQAPVGKIAPKPSTVPNATSKPVMSYFMCE